MYRVLDNVDINLQMRTISYDDNSTTPLYLEITDGDLMLLEYWNLDSFLYLFVEYCSLRVKYINGGNFLASQQMFNAGDIMDPLVITWAENLRIDTYPNMGGGVERVKLYPGGGFKILWKTYE